MGAILKSAKEKVDEISATKEVVIKKMISSLGENDVWLYQSHNMPKTDYSIDDMNQRVDYICGIISSIKSEFDESVIPRSLLNTIIEALNNLEQHYNIILERFNKLENDGGIGFFSGDDYSIKSKNGNVNYNISSNFKDINNTSDILLEKIYPLINIIKSEKFTYFASAFNTYKELLKGTEEEYSELKKFRMDAEKHIKEVSGFRETAKDIYAEVENLKNQSLANKKTLSEYEHEGTQSLTSIRATLKDAEKLKVAVDSYSADFDNFQKKLNEREEKIKTGNEKQEKILNEISESNIKIGELNDKAESMLSGATVAGLAGTYESIRKDLSKELERARWVFYFSIFVLFVSVIPLVLYAVPGLNEWIFNFSNEAVLKEASAWEIIAQVLARALLLIPAAWFTKFSAARHSTLFKLKENYAYKYSVAASVEGFKKQAEEFQDEIAATTFFELTFNPANRMDGHDQSDRHPNPCMERIMKKFGMTSDGR